MSGNSRRRHKYDSKKGIQLDIGCGDTFRTGYVRLDKDKRVKPDIVHDLEKFPYPIEDNICLSIVACHIIEHIKPWLMLDLMNELWRISKVDGQLAIKMPYSVNYGYVQDPTHCNPCNETTWLYFDPRYDILYSKYKPKPWRIRFSSYQHNGNMEVILEKILPPKTTSGRSKNSVNAYCSVSRPSV